MLNESCGWGQGALVVVIFGGYIAWIVLLVCCSVMLNIVDTLFVCYAVDR